MASRNRSRSLSTPSEGEIIESGSEMKATASKPPLNGTSVDRPPRDSTSSALRSPSLRGSRSPRRRRSWTRSRSHSRSPYRDNRGYKRRRDDEYDGQEGRNARQEPSRRFGSRYDDRPYDRNAPSRRQKSYYDYDREESYGGGLQYTDDYDRRRDKRPRTHSRSPYREVRKPKQYDDPNPNVEGTRPQADTRRGLSYEQVVSERGKTPAGARDPKLGAETRENQVQHALPKRARFSDEADIPMSEPAEEPEPSEPMDEAAALEARRKRREAIKAKYRSQATPMHLKALQVPDGETDSSTPGTEPTSAQDMSGRSYGPRQNYVEQKLMCADSLG
ncbi:hypothetical protein PENSUB_7712 [Penicillium subrubescens]|uniref:Uncharacterized protein n=1 Tax=Penicillium subrubescens TaxID=1316194 RepID=A0A1Q5TKP1_9EURO|nr:hypothetical protein PENSUB_7712 [Penicillium subrubescens]